MKQDFVIAALLTVGLHAAILFGFRIGTQAVALPLGNRNDAVEVSLVAAAEEEAPAASEPETAPEPPKQDPQTPPEPEPPPPPPDVTPIPEPEKPAPEPTPAPEPRPSVQPVPAKPRAHPTPAVAPAHHAGATTATPGAAATGSTSSTGGGVKGGATSAPRYRSNPQPEYPVEAKRERQQGTVVLSVEVSAEGRPTSVTLSRSSGFPLLDQSAIAGVRRWTFEPGRAGGLPIASHVEVPVRFRLAQ